MSEKLCLQWNDFSANIKEAFGNLREDKDFNDVTLVCEDGQQVTCHRIILVASSPFFQNLLRMNKHSNLLVYMRGVSSLDLVAILDFLYCGEANLLQENLDSFLALAEDLQLKGLRGRATAEDLTQEEKVKRPKKNNQAPKKVGRHTPSDPFESNVAPEILSKNQDIKDETVLPTNNLTEDFQELDEKINSLMEKTLRKLSSGKVLYTCKVCGKEAQSGDVKKHIEANHLEGVSIPCRHCDKTFRSMRAVDHHAKKWHLNEI